MCELPLLYSNKPGKKTVTETMQLLLLMEIKQGSPA